MECKIKRGRKPTVPNASTTSEQTPSKRGRKPKVVYNGFSNDAPHSTSDDDNIIMKLNVCQSTIDISQQFVMNTSDLPDAYNIMASNTFMSKPYEIDSADEDDESAFSDIGIESAAPANRLTEESNLKVVQLLKDFEEKNKHNEWPSNTSISCYWCCHRFQNAPFGIPVKYVDGRFHVFGCFCSLECAAAHNVNNKESMDEMWERYNLINMLSRRIDYKPFVKPAPSRLSLSMFGGHMTIEDFRSYTDQTKLININFPPMMTMMQQIEEINESDVNNDFKYIPIDTDRINKYKEKLKLKRTKPLTDYKNTLDHTMNLKFGQ